MTMIKIEVPNSDIDAIELAGEFFTNLANAKRSTIAQVMSHIHRGEFEGEVTQSPIENVTVDEIVKEFEKSEDPNLDTSPVEVVTGEVKEELNATIPTPEQAEEFRESMTEMEFVTPPPIPSVPSVPSIPSVPNVTIPPSELPYDERIHSSGKTRNQDGTWKLRRRPAEMDEEQWKDYIEQCELENAKLMQLGGGDTSEDVEKITFEELIMKIQPQLAVPNPDFEKQCQAIATSLGLNHMSDLRRAEHLIPEFLKQLDLDGQGVN